MAGGPAISVAVVESLHMLYIIVHCIAIVSMTRLEKLCLDYCHVAVNSLRLVHVKSWVLCRTCVSASHCLRETLSHQPVPYSTCDAARE